VPTGHITAVVAREEWPDKSDANFARRMVSMKEIWKRQDQAIGRARPGKGRSNNRRHAARTGGRKGMEDHVRSHNPKHAQIKLTANIGLGNGGQHHAPTRPFRGKLVLNRSRESMASSLSRLTTRSNTDRASRALDEACWIAAR